MKSIEAEERQRKIKAEVEERRARWAAMPEDEFKAAAMSALAAAMLAGSSDVVEASTAVREWGLRGIPLPELDKEAAPSGSGVLDWCVKHGQGGAVEVLLSKGLAGWRSTSASERDGGKDLPSFACRWLFHEWKQEAAKSEMEARSGRSAVALAFPKNVQFEADAKLALRFYHRHPKGPSDLLEGGRAAFALIEESIAETDVPCVSQKSIAKGFAKVVQRLGNAGCVDGLDMELRSARQAAAARQAKEEERSRWQAPLNVAFQSDSPKVAQVLLDGAHFHGVDLRGAKSASYYDFSDGDDSEGLGSRSCSVLWLALRVDAFKCGLDLLARGFPTGAAADGLTSKSNGSKNPFRALSKGNLDAGAASKMHSELGMAIAKEVLDQGWVKTREEAAAWAGKLAEQACYVQQSKNDHGQAQLWEACVLSLSGKLGRWARGMEPDPPQEASGVGPRL